MPRTRREWKNTKFAYRRFRRVNQVLKRKTWKLMVRTWHTDNFRTENFVLFSPKLMPSPPKQQRLEIGLFVEKEIKWSDCLVLAKYFGLINIVLGSRAKVKQIVTLGHTYLDYTAGSCIGFHSTNIRYTHVPGKIHRKRKSKKKPSVYQITHPSNQKSNAPSLK